MRRLKPGTAGIAVAALALTLAACGSDGGNSDSNTDGENSGGSGDLSAELTWWDTSDPTNEAPAYDKLIEAFNEGLTWFAPGSDWTRTGVFGILILILVFRPEGLLGERTPEGA